MGDFDGLSRIEDCSQVNITSFGNSRIENPSFDLSTDYAKIGPGTTPTTISAPKQETLLTTAELTPIADLSPSLKNWKIQAKVTKIHPTRHWKNEKESGTLFDIDLEDNFGARIQALIFNNKPDSEGNPIEVDREYLIENAKVEVANPKFDTSKHKYHLVF